MAYKEPKLSPKGAKALIGGWNDGVGGKSSKKTTPSKKSSSTKKK